MKGWISSPTIRNESGSFFFFRVLSPVWGFRKVVPDKWEFANENFRQGQEELLSDIWRRKSVTVTTHHPPSQPNSAGEDLGLSSTSSSGSKNLGLVETAAGMVADLSDENEKLRRENETLSSELAAARRQPDELVMFLTEHLKVGPDEIDRMVGTMTRKQSSGADETDGGAGAGEGLKLFGVWLRGERQKRVREEEFVVGGSHVEFIVHAPMWKSSKVCN